MVLNNLLNSSMHAWDSKPDFQSSFSFSFNSFSMCRSLLLLTRFMVHKNLEFVHYLFKYKFFCNHRWESQRQRGMGFFVFFLGKILRFLSWQKRLFSKERTLLILMLWFRLTDDYKSKKDVLKSSDFLRRPQKFGPSYITNLTKISFISVKL